MSIVTSYVSFSSEEINPEFRVAELDFEIYVARGWGRVEGSGCVADHPNVEE